MRLNLVRLLCLACVAWTGSALAVGTAFTYQGTLEDGGQPANGNYDLVFQLRTLAGSNLFSPILFDDVPVSGGVFTVTLDFGLGAFPGADRRLGIGVRPGDSAGLYTTLTPDVVLTAAPYAQFARESINAENANFAAFADSAFIANDVTNNAIDEGDINTDAVSARNLANDSVGIANLIGANYTSPANLDVTLGGNACFDSDVPVTGGFAPGDVVILNTVTALASNFTVIPLEVVATNTVRIRFCNNGSSTQSITNLSIRLISLR